MRKVALLFVIALGSFITVVHAKGHGGGHGGGGGGHHVAGRSSGGGFHGNNNVHAAPKSGNGMRASSGASSGMCSSGAAARTSATSRPVPGTAANINVAPRAGVIGRTAATSSTSREVTVVGPRGASAPYYGYYYSPYEYGYGYGYGNPYYMNPYYYNPFWSGWYMGMGVIASPHYYNTGYAPNPGSATDDEVNGYELSGFVVYEHDTIPGIVTFERSSIAVENKDSGKLYDYKFKIRNKGLSYVTVYFSDSSNVQLNMVRLPGDKKQLWRVLHEGKINLYDKRRGFIYTPDDVDVRTIAVVDNGEIIPLFTHSVPETKRRLIDYVNKAYGSSLDPKKYTWKELLVYIDKLD